MSAVLEGVTVRPAVIPYYKEKEHFPPNVLNLLYRKMVAQGLDREVLHNHAMMEAEFVDFANGEALTSIALDLNGSYAGFAWLQNIEETETLKKGMAAFMFFREYWAPQITEAFGKICLGQWFNVVGMDVIYGLTPTPNKLARRYCQRLGFKYTAEIPGFVSYHGAPCGAGVGTMTRDEFNAKG